MKNQTIFVYFMLMTIYDCNFLSTHIVTCIFTTEIVRVLLNFTSQPPPPQKKGEYKGFSGHLAQTRDSCY